MIHIVNNFTLTIISSVTAQYFLPTTDLAKSYVLGVSTITIRCYII